MGQVFTFARDGVVKYYARENVTPVVSHLLVQLLPEYEGRQSQRKPVRCRFTHTPPVPHGMGAHGSFSGKKILKAYSH